MAVIRKTALVDRELIKAWELYEDRDAADQFIDNFFEQFQRLAENPTIGVNRSDIDKDLCYFPYKDYIIVYRVVYAGVEIVAVSHYALFLTSARH